MFVSSIVQLVCLCLAGTAIWLLWRAAAPASRLLASIIALGMIARSLGSQLLFWFSYLELPLGRSLQLGGGFWFFGVDGRTYFRAAAHAGEAGLGAIFSLSPTVPSVFYVKVLAVFVWLFGAVVSTALFLNLILYLGTALLIVRWGARRGVDSRVMAVPLAAISFLPSTILWSLQPLKDGFVCFLAVLFVVALDSFVNERMSNRGQKPTSRLLLITVLLCVCLYAIAGIRWYYALILMSAATIPLLSTMARQVQPRRMLLRTGVVFVVILLLSQQVVAGAGPYLPNGVRDILRPWRSEASLATRINHLGGVIKAARDNFDHYRNAGTRIRSGEKVVAHEPRREPESNPSSATTSEGMAAAKALASVEGSATPAGPIPEPELAETSDVPTTRMGRLTSGLAALLLPRQVGEALGMVSIGGGRGMWWFVDVDTILFLVLAICTFVLLVAGLRRGAWRDPLVWYLLIATMGITTALAYTVSNYGTLFRHRQMVVATLALIGLAAARPRMHIAAGPQPPPQA